MPARPKQPATRPSGRSGLSGRKARSASAPRVEPPRKAAAARRRRATAKPATTSAPDRRPRPVAAEVVPPAAAAAAAPRPHPWPHLTARDVMRRDVLTIDRATPLSEVERVLSEQRISGAPVTDETGAIVGVVSMRDLVERYVEDADARPRRSRGYFHLSSEELDDDDFERTELPEETEETAEDVMTAEVFSVAADASLAEVARVMVERRIHRVLVESGGHFAGLVGSFEILEVLAREGAPRPSQGSPP